MLGDKENLHYVVGLTGPEYSVILDLDDFNSIKDLTRLKLGLTIKGIRILRDNSGKFKDAINKFNVGRKSELAEIEALSSESDKKNFIFNSSPQHFNLLFQLVISSIRYLFQSCSLLISINQTFCKIFIILYTTITEKGPPTSHIFSSFLVNLHNMRFFSFLCMK